MFLFCLTDGDMVWYNANVSEKIQTKCPYRWKKRGAGAFPLPYEVCSFSANMALTSSACRQQSAVKGGTLQNKKRYPSGLETDWFPSPKTARRLCRDLRWRVWKNDRFVARRPHDMSSRRQSSLFITSGFSAVCGRNISAVCFCRTISCAQELL